MPRCACIRACMPPAPIALILAIVENNNSSCMAGTQFEEAATVLMAVSHLPNNTFLVLATGGRTRGTKLITKELCKALLRPAVRVDCGCVHGAKSFVGVCIQNCLLIDFQHYEPSHQ